MPIRLLVGPAGSGKTARILQTLKQSTPSEQNTAVRLIVPSVSQVIRLRKLLLADPAFPGILGDPICTFARLASDILTDVDVPRSVTDIQRAMILRRILSNDSSSFFSNCPSMPHELGRVIGLLKSSGIAPDDLANAVTALGDACPSNSRRKLTDLSGIYRAYEDTLASMNLCEPQDLILRAIQRPDALSRFKCVMLDGFSRLAPHERRLLQVISEHCADVIITVEYDERRPDLFTDAGSMLRFLTSLPGTSVENMHAAARTSALSHVQQNLFAPNPPMAVPDDTVIMLTGATSAVQIEMVAGRVKRLVREQGCRYSDIAIVARSARPLRRRIVSVFSKYRIPITGEFIPLLESAIAQHLLSRLDGSLPIPDDPRAAVESLLKDIPLPEGEDQLREHFASWKSIRRIAEGIYTSAVTIGKTLATDEFIDLLSAGIRTGTFRIWGEIDGVSVISAGSLDGRKFRAVFILDLIEGAFPLRTREDPFINDFERESLNPHLPDPLRLASDEQAHERHLLYRAVSSAKERLYLCYPKLNGTEPNAPSPYLDEISALFTGALAESTREPGSIVPPMDEVETMDELAARTILDCCAATDEETHRIAASSYNALLDAGLLGPDTFEWLAKDYPEPIVADDDPTAGALEDRG